MGKPIQLLASGRLLGYIHAGEPSPPEELVAREFMGTWHADVYTLRSRDVFIFTEERTLYSIFADAKGVDSVDAFVPYFGDAMERSLQVEMPILEKIDDWRPALRFFRSEDTRVRRAQTAHARMALDMDAAGGGSSECNERPLPEADGIVPRSMYRAEIWRIFPELLPRFTKSQMN